MPKIKKDAIPSSLPEAKPESSLETILLEKVATFSDLIGQIRQEILSRKRLSENITYRIDYQYCTLKSYFLTLDEHWEMGRNRSVELRRSRLEQQLNQLLAEKRMEQSRCWKDISLLNKECRTWFKQYRDLLQRVKIVLPHGSFDKSTQNRFKLDFNL